jgi:hypothetical protein
MSQQATAAFAAYYTIDVRSLGVFLLVPATLVISILLMWLSRRQGRGQDDERPLE